MLESGRAGFVVFTGLSYSDSQNPRHLAQADMHILQLAPTVEALHRRQPDFMCCRQRDKLAAEDGRRTPAKERNGRKSRGKKLPEAFNFRTVSDGLVTTQKLTDSHLTPDARAD